MFYDRLMALYERAIMRRGISKTLPHFGYGHKPDWFHQFIGDIGARVRVRAWMRLI